VETSLGSEVTRLLALRELAREAVVRVLNGPRLELDDVTTGMPLLYAEAYSAPGISTHVFRVAATSPRSFQDKVVNVITAYNLPGGDPGELILHLDETLHVARPLLSRNRGTRQIPHSCALREVIPSDDLMCTYAKGALTFKFWAKDTSQYIVLPDLGEIERRAATLGASLHRVSMPKGEFYDYVCPIVNGPSCDLSFPLLRRVNHAEFEIFRRLEAALTEISESAYLHMSREHGW